MTDMLYGIASLGGFALFAGIMLAVAMRLFHVEGDPMSAKIDAMLPQTQCAKCGYPGCKPYSEAVAKGEAGVNQCVPGGERVMLQIAELMGVEPVALDQEPEPPMLAFVREDECIGCTLCIKACPVDAILGAPKQYHTVIADHCTGCKLCIEPCPVDCIDMILKPEVLEEWTWTSPEESHRPILIGEQDYAARAA